MLAAFSVVYRCNPCEHAEQCQGGRGGSQDGEIFWQASAHMQTDQSTPSTPSTPSTALLGFLSGLDSHSIRVVYVVLPRSGHAHTCTLGPVLRGQTMGGCFLLL